MKGKLTVQPDKEIFGSWTSKYEDLDFHFELTGRVILPIHSVASGLTFRRSVVQGKSDKQRVQSSWARTAWADWTSSSILPHASLKEVVDAIQLVVKNAP